MFKQLNIVLYLFLSITFNFIYPQDNFEIFVPESITPNTTFEISIITFQNYQEADRLDIYFSPEISLNITNAELRTNDRIYQLPIQTEFIEDYSEQFSKVNVDLTDSATIPQEYFFQLVISLKSSQSNSNKLNFFGNFLNGEKVIGHLINSNYDNNSHSEKLYTVSFNYYDRYSAAGEAIVLAEGSNLNIPLVYNFEKILAAEFWMKFKTPAGSFLEIINWETNRTEYQISLDDNQMIGVNSSNEKLLAVNPYFISENCWYHFAINFEEDSSKISFFCNGIELASDVVQLNVDFQNLLLHFKNETPNAEFTVDQLRVINLSEYSSAIESNKNYIDYADVNSNLILQLNFEEKELSNSLLDKTISYDKINLEESDAPIFPRSPEINVIVSDSYFEIEWGGGSYKDALNYIVEKSTENREFEEISKITAADNENKLYSILTENVQQSEIIYFRIKQINKDGSVIYSEIVKVGQGKINDVILGQNYPNPFNPTTLIEFELLQDSDVELKIYNLAGNEIALLHKGPLSEGTHKFEFDASGFPSGVYLYQIKTPLSSQTHKMILAK